MNRPGTPRVDQLGPVAPAAAPIVQAMDRAWAPTPAELLCERGCGRRSDARDEHGLGLCWPCYADRALARGMGAGG